MTFEESYVLYAKDVWRFAFFLCGDQTLADDITSESFVRIWSSPRMLRDQTLKSYLFATARNLFLNQRRRSVVETEIDEGMLTTVGSMEESLDHANRLRETMVRFQRLGEEEQAALVLRSDGRSYEEIGEQLNIRPDAAKMRVHRARRKLLEAIK